MSRIIHAEVFSGERTYYQIDPEEVRRRTGLSWENLTETAQLKYLEESEDSYDEETETVLEWSYGS